MKTDSIIRRVRDAVHHLYPFLALSEINVTISSGNPTNELDVVLVESRSPFFVPLRGLLEDEGYLYLTPFDEDDSPADDDHVFLTIRVNLSTIEE